MDLRFLESLIAVVEAGSIAGAARRQGLTAAAVGQRVQALERAFGAPLLTRTGRSVRPAPAAAAILPRARRLVAEARGFARDLAPGGLGGELRLGAVSTALVGMLPRAMVALRAAAPELFLAIRAGSSAELYAAVAAQELVAAVIVAPRAALPKALRALPLERQPLCLMLPPGQGGRGAGTGGGAKGAPPVEAAELAAVFARWPLIRYDPRSWGGQIAADYVAHMGAHIGHSPRILCDLDGLEAIALMVEAGLGAALVPRWSPGLQARALPHGDDFAREVILLVPAGEAETPRIAALVTALRAALTGG